jgi:hypothetical protein
MTKQGGAYGPLRGTTAGGVAKAFRGKAGFKESQALQKKLTRMADLKQKLKNIKSAYKLELNKEKVGVGTVVPMTQAIAGSALLIGGAPIAHKIEKFFKKRKEKKETKQKQSMTSNKAYSSKFFGHTDNKNK